jgi:hypothetical protein
MLRFSDDSALSVVVTDDAVVTDEVHAVVSAGLVASSIGLGSVWSGCGSSSAVGEVLADSYGGEFF